MEAFGGSRNRDICYAFQRGECNRGESFSKFSHNDEITGENTYSHLRSSSHAGGKRSSAICFAFQRGECDRGNSCKFSHSVGSVIESHQDSFYVRKATGVCYAFQTGECDRGETCRYLHEAGDVPTNYSGPRERGKCYAFQRGTCFRGETCRFSHDFTLESEQPKPDGVALWSRTILVEEQ